MVDVHDKRTRSKNMAAIRGSNTKPEVWLRKKLFARGFRYRINDKRLPGKPDIVLSKYKTVIFVNGCFWHFHDCHLFKMPATRTAFWMDKLSATKERDKRQTLELFALGWNVIVVWECAIVGKWRLDEDVLLSKLVFMIKNSSENTKGILEVRS